MKKVLKNTFLDMQKSFKKFAKNNINFICNFLQICLPFIMFAVGKYSGKTIYLLFALVTLIIIFFVKSIYKQIVIKDKLSDLPIPRKRFTKESNGEVNMEQSRLEELLLYTNELENWIEEKGIKK